MTRFNILLILVALMAIGLGRLLLQRKRLIQRLEFGRKFLANLHSFMDSDGSDMKAYTWLTHRSHKMQQEMGSSGIYESFRPPHANYVYTHYPLILNMLPELRKWSGQRGLGVSSQFSEYGDAIQEALIRYDGQLEDRVEHISESLKNPFLLLREGIQFILFLPVHIWAWFRIGGSNAASRFATGAIAAFLSGAASLLALASTVVTVVVGAPEAIEILARWLN